MGECVSKRHYVMNLLVTNALMIAALAFHIPASTHTLVKNSGVFQKKGPREKLLRACRGIGIAQACATAVGAA